MVWQMGEWFGVWWGRSLRNKGTGLTRRAVLGAVQSTIAVALLVGAADRVGVLRSLENAKTDLLYQLRPSDPITQRLAVVLIDDQDLEQLGGWPVADQYLAEAIAQLAAAQPQSIALDLYRDLPVEPGGDRLAQLLAATPEVIGVRKVVPPVVAAPPTLAAADRVAASDLTLDLDGKVRRTLLSVDDGQNQTVLGLGTRLALDALAAEGITLETVQPEHQVYQLGQAVFRPLRTGDAGYLELGGYQILLDYVAPSDQFETLPLRTILAGDWSPEWARDRIVLIGVNSDAAKDHFQTPYSTPILGENRQMPGVIVHANITGALLAAAYGDRPVLRPTSPVVTWGIIALGAVLGTVTVWGVQRRLGFALGSSLGSSRSTLALLGAGGVTVLWAAGWLGFTYGAFRLGWLLPATGPLVALFGTAIVAVVAHKQYQLQQANHALESANGQLRDYSQTLELRVQERTAELATAKRAADAANRAKSDFLASMSHELRTPLNGILGYAQILQRDSSLGDRQQSGVQTIYQCGSHLLTLIEDVLDLSKIEARKLELYPQPLHVDAFLAGILDLFQLKTQDKGIDLIGDFDPQLPLQILADEKRLRQVLINLVGNAVKFTDVGAVTLRVRSLPTHHADHPDREPGNPADHPEYSAEYSADPVADGHAAPERRHEPQQEPQQEHPPEHLQEQSPEHPPEHPPEHLQQHPPEHLQEHAAHSPHASPQDAASRYLEFVVEDTGIGMEPDQLETIFQPFEQVGESQRRSQGTGLGLAIGRQIVQLMGGELWVTSQPGMGSRFGFRVALPVLAERPALSPAEAAILGTHLGTDPEDYAGSYPMSAAIAATDTVAPTIVGIKSMGVEGTGSEGAGSEGAGSEARSPRLLIADTNASSRAILLDSLQPLGFQVAEATTLEALWQAVPGAWDLILLALMWPDHDGVEVLRQLRSHHPQIPVVIVSAAVFAHDRDRCLAAGCRAFLQKPVDIDHLLDQLQQILQLQWCYDSTAIAPRALSAQQSSWGDPPLIPATQTPAPVSAALQSAALKNGQTTGRMATPPARQAPTPQGPARPAATDLGAAGHPQGTPPRGTPTPGIAPGKQRGGAAAHPPSPETVSNSTPGSASQPRATRSPAPASPRRSPAIALPPSETIAALHHLAMMGDIYGVRSQAEALQAENGQWADFARRAIILADAFEIKKLRVYLAAFLNDA